MTKHVGEFEKWGIDRVLRDLGVSDSCVDQGGLFHCLTFVHGDAGLDKNGNWVSIDEQVYEVDDKLYRKTGGYYGLGFEPDKGGQ